MIFFFLYKKILFSGNRLIYDIASILPNIFMIIVSAFKLGHVMFVENMKLLKPFKKTEINHQTYSYPNQNFMQIFFTKTK